MKKSLCALALVALLTAAGCSTPTGAAYDSSVEVPAPPGEAPEEESPDGILDFGEGETHQDGVSISVGAPALFTAAAHEAWNRGVKISQRQATDWIPFRVNRSLNVWSTGSANPLTDATNGNGKRGTRSIVSTEAAETLVRHITGNRAGVLPVSTVHRFRAELFDSPGNGTVQVAYRPNVGRSANQVTLLTGFVIPTTGHLLDVTFTTPATTPTAKAGFVVLSGAGTANVDWIELVDVLIERPPSSPAGGYFNGDTADTAERRYSWAGTADASESIEEHASVITDPVVPPRGGQLANLSWDTLPLGILTSATLKAYVPIPVTHAGGAGGVGRNRLQVVSDPRGGRRLQFLSPAGSGGSGNSSGATFAMNFGDSSAAELEYEVEFGTSPAFDWADGGKMPGLRGGSSPGGGTFMTDGFSSRLMWQAGGGAILYLYHSEQSRQSSTSGYGDGIRLGVTFVPGQRYVIRQRVVMNTPGVKNGSIQVWINGISRHFSNRKWRLAGDFDWGVSGALITMFHGGNKDIHVSSADSKMFVDRVKVSRTP